MFYPFWCILFHTYQIKEMGERWERGIFVCLMDVLTLLALVLLVCGDILGTRVFD